LILEFGAGIILVSISSLCRLAGRTRPKAVQE
jgi:hypothetical protein